LLKKGIKIGKENRERGKKREKEEKEEKERWVVRWRL
jgi:hypothetical protein